MKKTTVRLLTVLSAATIAAQLHSASLATPFAADPAGSGWQAYGNTNLFAWDATNQNLRVTWDSAQPNSYFARPLGQTLSRSNDFLLTFDLNLSDIVAGANDGKPFAFQIAVGLMHHSQLTNAGVARGSGEAPGIVEFDYFPNDINDYGASVTTALISTTTNYWSGGFTFPLELATNTPYRVQMSFTAANQTLHTTMSSNGIPVGPITDARIGAGFGDFELDTVAISSYSDQGQYPGFEGSILAHGTVDNIAVASPLPVGMIATPAAGQVTLQSDASWRYTLEASTNFATWSPVAATVPGNGSTLILQDTNAAAGGVFYRVRADLP